MKFKDYLMSLRWNSFAIYPEQDSEIYLHCKSGDIHRFIRLKHFNAINFDVEKFTSKFDVQLRWQYSWLPALQTESDYDNRTDGGSDDDGDATGSPDTDTAVSETVRDTGKRGRKRKDQTIP